MRNVKNRQKPTFRLFFRIFVHYNMIKINVKKNLSGLLV